jgi:hypothetical protein
MRRNKYLLLLIASCFLIGCNTDIELCDETEHPHRANITFRYNWIETDAFTPKNMSVLAHRVINQWKGAMSINSLEFTGTYIFNAPEGEENDTVKYFKVPAGDYRFITFSMESDEFDYTNVEAFFNDPTINMKELEISYRTYSKKDEGLRFIIQNWTDYNNYSRYIQPSTKALFYDTLTTRPLLSSSKNTIVFNPKELTQQVDLSFDIKKVNSVQPFTVDSVFAEISGLPNTTNLATGNLTIDKTYKMMFPMDKITDTDASKIVTCHSEIHVPGILCSSNKDMLYGPGIMQVMIYCSATSAADGKRKSKRFQGEINLYNTLQATPSLQLSKDEEHAVITTPKLTLKVKADLSIDGEHIIEATDDNGGLDVWKNATGDPQIIDI